MTSLSKRITTASAMVALACAASAAEPDRALLSAARAAQPAVIDSLRDMVAIESGTMDAAGLARIGNYAEGRLQALGAKTERRKTTGSNGGDVVVGHFEGSGRRKLMLIAHLDTIYKPGTLTSQPYKLDGNRLYGPGIADDKGGVAVILHSLAILREAGWKDYARLTVLFNSDEESQSAGSGQTVTEFGALHDVVLSYEPSPAKTVLKAEGVLLAAAGTGTAQIDVKGRNSHAGAAPEQGRNALMELAHQIVQTADIGKEVPGAQLNWTVASAGKVRNQIPDEGTALADVRLTAQDAAARLKTALEAKAANHLIPDTQVNVTIKVGRPPFAGDARTMALAKKAQAIYAELDDRPLKLIPGTGAGTDAGYASVSGKPAVLESMGLAGWGYHAKDEYIEIDSIVPRLYLTTRMLVELGRE